MSLAAAVCAARPASHSLLSASPAPTPLVDHVLPVPAKTAALRRFVCREDAPAYHAPSARPSRDYPVERSLRHADALSLSLRTRRDRIAIPLARGAAAFVSQQSWSHF